MEAEGGPSGLVMIVIFLGLGPFETTARGGSSKFQNSELIIIIDSPSRNLLHISHENAPK